MLTKLLRTIDIIKHVDNWFDFLQHFKKKELFILKLRSGLSFYIRPDGSDHNIFREVYIEKAYSPKEFESVKPSIETVVDIGAHIGFFSLYASTFAKRVISVEPTQSNGQLLKKNIELNNKQNVDFVNKAVGGKEGEQKMYINTSAYHTGLHSFYKEIATEEQGAAVTETTVPVITLESLLTSKNIEAVDLLKMDCEGAEYDILFNAPDSVLKRIKRMTISFHNAGQYTVKDLEKFLTEKGYTLSYGHGGHPLHAVRNDI